MNKVFFFDIDGTLSMHGVTPEGNIKALSILKEKGYPVFICTGRPPFYAKKLFGDLITGIICCNGRLVVMNNQILLSNPIPAETLDKIIQKFQAEECAYLLTSDTYVIPGEKAHKSMSSVIASYGEDRVHLMRDIPVYTVDFFYESLAQRDRTIEAVKDLLIVNDHHGHGSADCSTIDYDKGNAIKATLQILGIDRENAYAFGDGMNDIAMFRESGHRIAMGNAVEPLKKEATYVTSSIDQNGIMNALIHEGIIEE